MINRRELLKAAGLFVAASPAIIRPSKAQVLQFSGAASQNQNTYPFPVSMSDPRFIGMTERNSTLNCSANTTYSNQSWLDHNTTSWSALMNNNVTCNNWRMRTREGQRFRGYSNVNTNFFMLEVYGVELDHSDGFQWEGGNNTASFINTHFRAYSGSFTTGFIADESTGFISFENCLISCAPGANNGMVFYSTFGFSKVQISMKNVWIQQTGWGGSPFYINQDGSGAIPCDVVLWDNVNYCSWDHDTGTLTPGSPMPQPPNT